MHSLIDRPIDVKLKLSALWAATMACYIYCDYFELYVPGNLESMLAGTMGPLGAVTQGVLLGTAVLMAVPSLMIAGSVLLPARPNRVANLIVGGFYTVLLALLAATVEWHFYRLFAGLEAALTATIVVLAWRWPRGSDAATSTEARA
jgi:hypothetical protein